MFCTIVHEAADKLRSSCTSTLTCPNPNLAVTTDVLATLFYRLCSLGFPPRFAPSPPNRPPDSV